MGNTMIGMSMPNTIYLSDRGNDWYCDTLFCTGPKFKENRYNRMLANHGVSEAEFKAVLAKADKDGWRKLRPCWLIVLLGLFIFGALFFGNIIYGLSSRKSDKPGMLICTSTDKVSRADPFNQCKHRNVTNRAGEYVCCNFWCCLDDKERRTYSSNNQNYQTPYNVKIRYGLQEYKCKGISADRYPSDTESAYEGHAMISFEHSEHKSLEVCDGGHIKIEGEYVSIDAVETGGWPFYYFMMVPLFGIIVLSCISGTCFKCNCYRKTVMKVFEDAFLGKGIDVSWQFGGKHHPNFVLLHLNQVPQQMIQLVQPTSVEAFPAAVVNYPTAIPINEPNRTDIKMNAIAPMDAVVVPAESL